MPEESKYSLKVVHCDFCPNPNGRLTTLHLLSCDAEVAICKPCLSNLDTIAIKHFGSQAKKDSANQERLPAPVKAELHPRPTLQTRVITKTEPTITKPLIPRAALLR